MLVGSAPGREEAERGRPGVGSTGIELDRVLAEAGLQRSKLAFVYAIACRAPLNAPPRSDESAAKACRGYLLHQLRRVPADTPTLAMGRIAVLSLVGRDAPSLEKMRGFLNAKFRIPRNEE